MAITVNIVAMTAGEMKAQLAELLAMMSEPVPVDTLVRAPEEIKPVISQARMEENIKNAPEHKMPEMPSLEEVRGALKALRDRKGAAAVKDLLNEYNASSVPGLKEEDYLVVRDRALAEV